MGERVPVRRIAAWTGGRGDNLFLLPLKGGEPRQLTRFREGAIFSYAWTPDGKIVLSRGEVKTDAVLITDWRRKE